MKALLEALDSVASRRLLLFGGKGGVGKTTLAVAAALRRAERGPTLLFTTDPASSLIDLLGSDPIAGLTIEAIDAPALYRRFLAEHLEAFLEIGDRGTYLERDELRSLLELTMPGIDELMAWTRIGELAEADDDRTIVVDTAPTGHTLRMLSSGEHFLQLAAALDSMQEKHRILVRQFTRRNVRDAFDDFIHDFEARAASRRELLTDRARAAFIPVTLSEPLVVEQTERLIAELHGIDVPFVVLNRAATTAVTEAACERDRKLAARDRTARERLAQHVVVDARRSCVPIDSVAAIRDWMADRGDSAATPPAVAAVTARPLTPARFVFLAGKGGVGKTSCAASIALQLARANPAGRYVVISVDPAHSLRDVFENERPPANLAVETIDTRAKWERFRRTIGGEIEAAVNSLTPGGMHIVQDGEAMRHLVDIAPPGADELFAITRLSDLVSDTSLAGVIVDTAPTGHFLRLLDLPAVAGEWVREFMRLLLRYRELISPGSLGEELVRASRALKELQAFLASDQAAVVVVTRCERIVVAETRRLIDDVTRRGIPIGGVIANYLTPENDCSCDRSMRRFELAQLASLGAVTLIERRDEAPSSLAQLEALVPLAGPPAAAGSPDVRRTDIT